MNEVKMPAGAISALARGSVLEASHLLGFEYFIKGEVIHGNHLGRTLGFPTANLDLDKEALVLPAHGVYPVRIEHAGRFFKGISNIGLRPTINGKKITVEVNIFDFDEDLYGETLTVWFFDRIREEKKFENLEELTSQIRLDKEMAISLLSRLG
jgi:riboflavin kinase/FMN adenylyltransferase